MIFFYWCKDSFSDSPNQFSFLQPAGGRWPETQQGTGQRDDLAICSLCFQLQGRLIAMALLEFANNERKQCLLMRPPHYCCFRRRQVLFFWRTLPNSYRAVNLPT